ncbi:MFS transporter [Trinickia acidisoli]|uniref:MFS transporter n=1 Tax=Trinickia acidisoli TaxID=2767482 RepID=UPI001A8EC561|nr:MFS transporter [Trinickia acidisoli]
MSASKIARFTRDELKIVAIVTVLLFIGLLGTDIHLSSLPEMAKVMHVSPQYMQASISIFLFGTGVGSLVYGPVSDKCGRKPVILIGVVIAIVGNLWAVFASKIAAFLISRFVQGVGSGACLALSRIVLSDIVQGERYAIASSYITLFTGLSFVLGPLLGSFVQSWFGWRGNFVAMSLLLASIFVVYSQCRETNTHKNKSITAREVFASYKVVLSDTTFVSSAIMAGIGITCFVMYTSSSPFVLQQQFGFSSTHYGWAIALVGVGLVISRLLLPRLIAHFGMLSTMFVGFVIPVICGSALLLLSKLGYMSAGGFLASVAGVSFSYSFIVLCASAICMSRFPTRRGAAGAVYCCSQMAIAFGVNSVVSSVSSDIVTLLGVSYMALPALGLFLCARMGAADKSKRLFFVGK